MRVLGIDPGVNGALALVRYLPGENRAPDVAVYDIPTLQVVVGKRARARVDFHALCNLMHVLAADDITLAVIEDIERGGVRPGQSGGVTFGKCAGALEAFAITLGVPLQLVPPATWKRSFGLAAGKTQREKSDAARLAASRVFPADASQWPLVKHDGRAEAALLGWYGLTKVLGVKP